MKTPEHIAKIKSKIQDPYTVDNFLTQEEVDYLINVFDTNPEDRIEKNTGPITLDVVKYIEEPIFVKILEKVKNEIGDFDFIGGIFFSVTYPHIIHNDDSFETKGVFKGVNLPLKLEGTYTELPDLCFFNQFYFRGPAKFLRGEGNGEVNIPTYYNQQVYDYSDVDGVVDGTFDNDIRLKYFTHVKPQWLDGLTLCKAIKWKPTSAIIFDTSRLHCASDFRQQGITSKLGISIFVKYQENID